MIKNHPHSFYYYVILHSVDINMWNFDREKRKRHARQCRWHITGRKVRVNKALSLYKRGVGWETNQARVKG